jgi:hypothetical protein
MNSKLIDLIEYTKGVRSELVGKVEDSVIGQIDDLILQLENQQNRGHPKLSNSDLLLILSILIEKLPTIVSFLQELIKRI